MPIETLTSTSPLQTITKIDSNIVKTFLENKTALAIPNTTILVAKINSKVYKPATYNKAIFDLIHNQQWRKAIKEELQNFKQYNTWGYDKLPSRKIVISSK